MRCVGFNETFTDGRTFDKLSQLVDGTYQGIDAEGQYGNDPYPVLDGTINLSTGAYRDTYDALMTHYPKLKLNIAKWWIRFEDPEVKRICVENWDKDGDGELSMEEAAAVSSIGTKFYNNNKIVSLKALRYFKIQELGNDTFGDMSNLREVWLPATVKAHWYRTFLDSPNIKIVVLLSEVPFTDRSFFNINTYGHIPSDLKIYVPDTALLRYKEAWKNFPYLSRLHPLSEYQE